MATNTAFSYLRFSTKGQIDSDSLRRQLDASRRYASERGWHLDESLRDLGVSAYKGRNRETGALSRFLQLIDEGRVKPGSWLIVEAIDRLSREEVSKSLTMFLKIVSSGVGIVTLLDRREYTEESINKNPFELMYSIALMAAANEYSSKLSKRVREAKDNALRDLKAGRRAIIHGKPPYWITYNKAAQCYALHPERAAIVREAVSLTMDGKGTSRIAKIFSTKKYKTHSGKTQWRDTSLGHILRSRCLIGEYTPRRIEAGRKMGAKGDPIPNYYPALLTREEFYALQAKLETRKKAVRGRRGSGIMFNLFGRMLICGHDGTKMVVVARRNRRGNKKLYKSVANDEVFSVSFPYEPLVKAFLAWVSEVELRKSSDRPTNDVEVLRGRRVEGQQRLQKLKEALTAGEVSRLSAVVEAVAKVQGEVDDLTRQIEMKTADRHKKCASPEDVAALSRMLAKASGDELVELQQRVRIAISEVVERAYIWVAGNTVRRAAVLLVLLRDGQMRLLSVKTERGRNPVTISDGARLVANPDKVPDPVDWGRQELPDVARALADARSPDEMVQVWQDSLKRIGCAYHRGHKTPPPLFL